MYSNDIVFTREQVDILLTREIQNHKKDCILLSSILAILLTVGVGGSIAAYFIKELKIKNNILIEKVYKLSKK